MYPAGKGSLEVRRRRSVTGTEEEEAERPAAMSGKCCIPGMAVDIFIVYCIFLILWVNSRVGRVLCCSALFLFCIDAMEWIWNGEKRQVIYDIFFRDVDVFEVIVGLEPELFQCIHPVLCNLVIW